MKNTLSVSRRKFIKSGIVITAGLPMLQACNLFESRDESDPLFTLFRHPPSTAKPFVRWWWNGNKVSAKEILREMDVMKEAGIGGFEINSIAFPVFADDMGIPSLTWLSPEWIEMVKVALKGAEERDMTCDIIVGSGWPFGAEFLAGDEQSQLLTLTTRKVKGPGKITLKTADILKEVTPPHPWGYNEDFVGELYSLSLAPIRMDTFTPPILLPFEKGDEITVQIPAGEYILYVFMQLTGFQSVIYGAPGASGPVLNHYNKAAVEKYLNRMSDRLYPELKGLKGFRALFCDSLELDANWCLDFLDEFKRRNGYDLTPYMPYVFYKLGELGSRDRDAGIVTYATGAAREEIERVRYDLTVTRMELFRERFLEPLTQWCTRHGFKSKIQAYGREYHPLEASLIVDIPECETWMWNSDNGRESDMLRGVVYTDVNKYVSSAVHLSGKKEVSCEEVTNTTAVFNITLERLKLTGDMSNLSGVTHSVLHGFSYSPREAAFPGWVRYGTFFNERNTWWPYFKLWSTYKTRLSAILMETDFFADIAVLHPLADMWSKFGPQNQPYPSYHYPRYQYRVWEAIHRNGNSCDYTSETIIQQSVSTDGFLRYNRRAYHTLILLEVESMLPATAEAIAAFVKNGGKVIFVGKEPYKSPGMNDSQSNDEKVRKTIADMKANHAMRVFRVEAPPAKDSDEPIRYNMEVPTVANIDEWFRNVQRRCDVKPYMKIDKPSPYISQIRHRTNGLDLFFISNCSMAEGFEIQVEFPESKGRPRLWNPETGERSRYLGAVGNDRKLTIDLPPAASRLIVFEEKAKGHAIPASIKKWSAVMELKEWNVRMQHIDGTTGQRVFPTLFDLAADESTRSFAGCLFYEKTIDGVASSFNLLDLGRVFGVSEVTLNGENLGCRWYGRHRYNIPEHQAKARSITIQVKITTTVGNYLKSESDNKTGRQWTAGQGWQPTGMLGPVKLIEETTLQP